MMQWRYVVFWVHSIFEKKGVCILRFSFLFIWISFFSSHFALWMQFDDWKEISNTMLNQAFQELFRIVYSVIKNINSKSSTTISNTSSPIIMYVEIWTTQRCSRTYKRIFRRKGTVVTVWHDQREFINDTKNQNIFWIVQASINNTWIFCMLFQMI